MEFVSKGTINDDPNEQGACLNVLNVFYAT